MRLNPAALAAFLLTATPPATAYHLYIANESSDQVSKVVFTPGSGARLEEDVPVGVMPTDLDGPHGLTISPDGKYWYVSLAHGTPFGRVWKYAVDGDTLVGQVDLGMFPATMSVSADGEFLYAVNFNLHGDMVPSSVSVVHTPTMVEIARPTTCTMPHGSRVNVAGTKQYSVCMHDEMLVELDTRTFQVSKQFAVKPEGTGVCSPTWAQPGAGAFAGFVYVACNKSGEIVEVDAQKWQITRRFATGKGPYNMAVTPDGTVLVATLKAGQGVALIDTGSGTELARIATSRPLTHGVVVSPDGLYAFVTNEAVGSTRGTVDVIDLAARRLVSTVEVQYQPGGIDLLPVQQKH